VPANARAYEFFLRGNQLSYDAKQWDGSFTGHVIPRFALLAFVALLAGRDVYSLDALVRWKPRTIAGFDRRRPT
jgi:hypothetical protein